VPLQAQHPESLKRIIEKHGPGVVVVDAVYSTNGTICPLASMVDVASQLGCVIVVDESHSLGLFGKKGEGLTSALGLADRVHFRTASLSKAFAARGGIIIGSDRNMEYLRYHSRPAIFSSGVLPHEAAGYRAAWRLIARGQWRRKALFENAEYVRSKLAALGYNMQESQAQIISLIVGTDPQTLVVRDALQSRGIFGSVFVSPATPRNRALVRFSIQAAHTRAELDRLIAACAEIRDECRYTEWSSSRALRS
jgi:CAI-1 autoinducer synthase